MSESSSSSFVRPELEADWQEKMGRRLVWLRDLGVMGKVHIDVQPDGLPGFHGMPEEDVMNFLPTVTGPELVALALRDTRKHPLMGRPITILKGIDPTRIWPGKRLWNGWKHTVPPKPQRPLLMSRPSWQTPGGATELITMNSSVLSV
jgi:hypothetical protein